MEIFKVMKKKGCGNEDSEKEDVQILVKNSFSFEK